LTAQRFELASSARVPEPERTVPASRYQQRSVAGDREVVQDSFVAGPEWLVLPLVDVEHVNQIGRRMGRMGRLGHSGYSHQKLVISPKAHGRIEGPANRRGDSGRESS
jgi:hypothetical protein